MCLLLTACNSYNKVLKSADYEYKYEVAKECYFSGEYNRAQRLFGDVLSIMKGSLRAEESLFLLGMATYGNRDYETASHYFKKYYQSYHKGIYVEQARYYSGLSLYEGTLDYRLDQSNTYNAIGEFQQFLDQYPTTPLKPATQSMIYALQDKLVQKELGAAQLYYDLGTYVGNNSRAGGSNYESCIVTCENTLRDFPFANPERREELSLLLLKARYHLAKHSVQSRKLERYRAAIDEYYGFSNEFPESKNMKEATNIFEKCSRVVKAGGYDEEQE